MLRSIDRPLLIIAILLVVVGFFIFSSASLGLLAREGARFSSVAFSQFLFGIVGGSLAMLMVSNLHYRHWRQYAIYFFIATLVLTALVFVPGIGFSYGGATRWLSIGGFTFQPAELLKIGYVVYLATWLSGIHRNIHQLKYGLLPFAAITGAVGFIMLLQPDTDTFFIMAVAGFVMYITAGGNWRDVALMALGSLLLLVLLVFTRPYIMDRMMTFFDPSLDPQGSSYQIQQSLIAIGSGGVGGRGFGQSIQKFEYLPEPIGDSVFAVYAEEFGFVGSVFLISLLTAFSLRGYHIAARSRDLFGVLLVVGIVTLIIMQAFLNIAAMVGLTPLSGLPLPFISHGGTALLVLLTMVGIVLNVSKAKRA